MKIAIGVEYCGTSYSGWQRQKHAIGVQQHVEKALSKVADKPITIHCAGRTDTGVHALHQVIHFEADIDRGSRSWVMGGNSNLPGDIGLLWAKTVDDAFHARFSATGRHYRYIIFNRQTRPSVNFGYVSWEYRKLDEGAMSEAAALLVGKHDFSSFRAQGCQSKTPVREVTQLQVQRIGEYIIIDISANAFLQHMVRNIAGVLIEIGQGIREPSWASEVLDARNRGLAGITARPDGLYLTEIDYPEIFAIPKRNKPSWPILS
jgi:tRNA pseudouridine38-40 synthase